MSLLGLCALLASGAGCRLDDILNLDNPCDEVDCDDGSICTNDRCTFDLFGNTTCRYEAANEDVECGDDEVTLVCKGGRCGAASLCDGVECDDDDLCTVDECVWDGSCTFTEIDCDDDNDCTEDSCDSPSGECIHTPGEGLWGGSCILREADEQEPIPFGVCEEGVCAEPCDPDSIVSTPCPITTSYSCCPGNEYCQPECP
jgi:hypothetical protein